MKARHEQISITILRWDESKYRPRKDIAHPTWYKCSNRLLEDGDFYHFSAEEKLVWYRILELISQKQSQTVRIDIDHCKKVCGISPRSVRSGLLKLQELSLISIDPNVTETLRGRNADVTRTLHRIEENREEKNRREKNRRSGPKEEPGVPPGLTPQILVDLWNENRGSLPRCEKLSEGRRRKARDQILRYPDLIHWQESLLKLTTSPFCVSEWRPGIDDWFDESKRLRAIEGRYDGGKGLKQVLSDDEFAAELLKSHEVGA
jgi:hypothetical protein